MRGHAYGKHPRAARSGERAMCRCWVAKISHRYKSCRRDLACKVEADQLEVGENGLILCRGCAAIGAIHTQNARQVLAIAQLFWKR